MKIKFFFVEVSFPDIHDDTHAISVCSGLQSQCETKPDFHSHLSPIADTIFR